MKKQSSLTKLAIIFGVAVVVIAAVWLYLSSQTSSTNSCTMANQRCDLTVAAGDVHITFDNPPRAEEQIGFELRVPKDVIVEDILLEGDDMYMGKVPVFIKANAGRKLEGWFMLGSCSQPTMRWRMVIWLENRKDPLTIFFDAPAG